MKIQSVLISAALLWAFSVTAAAAAEETVVLSLEDAIELALKQNNDMRIAREDISFADAQVREARSGALPNLSVDNLYTRNLRLPAFFLDFDGEITKITVGSKNSFQTQATLVQPLWLGGKVGSALRAARIYREASQEGVAAAGDEVEFRVKELFYGILLTKEKIVIARQTLEQNEAHYASVKSKYEQGAASEFDLLRADVQVSNSRPDLTQAENALELLYTSLKNVLDLDPEKNVQIKGEFKYEPLDTPEIDEGSIRAFENRPDLKSMNFTSRMLEINIKIEKSGLYPNLYLLGNMQFMGQTNDFRLRANQRNISYSAGLQLQFPIFDGFRTSARVEQAEVEYQKMEYQINKFKNGIRTEIAQSVLRMEEANQRVMSLRRNVEQAEKAYNIAVVRFDNGIGTQLELFDSQLARQVAQINYLEGIYDYLMAKASWEKAVGR